MSLEGHKIEAGEDVYVVERDEYGEICECSGYMLIAKTGRYVIVSAYINDLETVEETMAYHADETVQNYTTDLSVFLETDCFTTLDEAKSVFTENQEEG